jgi:transcriptional regulator with XRE-family HTH domain
MVELDKAAMGRRIKQIRLQAGMRQWELARLLGTTQSAVHKYEHGVVPEPRRLVELSRIGRTSVEWVLTGQHWENGSQSQERLSPELLRTAQMLRQIQSEEMPRVEEALKIVRAAVEALRPTSDEAPPEVPVEAVRKLSGETLRLIESAWRIEKAVVRSVLGDTATRLSGPPSTDEPTGTD